MNDQLRIELLRLALEQCLLGFSQLAADLGEEFSDNEDPGKAINMARSALRVTAP